MKTWLCNGCVFFLCCQAPKYAPSLRKKKLKNFLKKNVTLLDLFCILNIEQKKELKANKKMLNGERGIPGRPKVVRGSKAPVLTSHAGLNPRSKSGYESGFAGELSKPKRRKALRKKKIKPNQSSVARAKAVQLVACNFIWKGQRPQKYNKEKGEKNI